MIHNKARIGNFTSSEIVALLSVGSREMTPDELAAHKKENPGSKKKNIADGFGEKALTYIEECNMERRLGRSLTDESNARPLTWGKLLEKRAFDLLGLEYILSSTDTDVHPTINYWAGSKDGVKNDPGKTIIDIKCPITLNSFCSLVQPLYDGMTGMDAMNLIRKNHKDGEKYYCQLVSNACINNAQFAELIVYVPYESELEEIMQMARDVEVEKLSAHYWIAFANHGDLPYILDNGYYKNLNIIRFEVPQADKELLKECVLRAGKELIQLPSTLMASPIPEGYMVEGA